jgi:dihydrofolate synthase / folylpolyglutamate synthase
MGEGKAAKKRDHPESPSPSDGISGRPGAPFASFDDAMGYLNARLNVESVRPQALDAPKVFQLQRMAALMERLGNPHRDIRSVHVAGSKGKGSVCEMTASCLEACGYTVGLFTSPHLVHLAERIRINQSPIAPADFIQHLSTVAAAAADLPKSLGEPTFFESLTAVAFLHFAQLAVDIAIIEVGLGGRTDATNIITPDVCAITAIQLEHTHLLGDTLEAIAREKAGILKKGIPAVTVQQPPAVIKVLRDAAAAAETTIDQLGSDIDFSFRVESSLELGPHARVVVSTPRSNFEHLPVPLRGEHQAANCGLALAILDRLRLRGIDTPETLVAQGLARTPVAGRLELVHHRPRIIVDGAHNPESIHAVIRAVGSQIRYDSLVVVFGCAADKDIPRMLANLATGADKIFFTRAAGNARAADPRDLQRKFAEASGKMTQTAPSVRDALNLAARAVQRDDLILVTGSFAIAGEAKQLLLEKSQPQRPDAIREVKPSALAPRPDDRPRRRP